MTSTSTADLTGLAIDRNAPRSRGPGARITLLLLLALVCLVAAVVGYRALHPAAALVTVARAEPLGGEPGAGATEILTANGYVVARQRASVSTEVSGRLARLHVEEGSRVVLGQVLGELENQDQRAAVESARAALAAAEADHAEEVASAHEVALERGRTESLLARGLVSQSAFDAVDARDRVAKARILSAAADVEDARARLGAATVAYAKTFIRAPFAGAVLRKEAEVGEIVTPIPSTGGLTRGAIVTMANLATLEVEVDVNEAYVARVSDGMPAEITLDAYPEERFPGRVRQVVPTADRQKATVLVKVAFERSDPRVLPEMGVRVAFLAAPGGAAAGSAGRAGAPAAAVTLPREALRESGGRPVVFVVEDGRAAMRAVRPRPYGADRVAIAGGVAPGELVVVQGPPTLADRARVKARQ